MKNLTINVGDYVRTKKRGFQPSQIARIKSISMKRDRCYRIQYYLELDHNLIPDYEFHIYEKDIEKSSPNIIDLIEEKDIITYEYETSIGKIIEYNVTVLLSLLNELEENPNKYKIKSIITHEQMEAMEYKIER